MPKETMGPSPEEMGLDEETKEFFLPKLPEMEREEVEKWLKDVEKTSNLRTSDDAIEKRVEDVKELLEKKPSDEKQGQKFLQMSTEMISTAGKMGEVIAGNEEIDAKSKEKYDKFYKELTEVIIENTKHASAKNNAEGSNDKEEGEKEDELTRLKREAEEAAEAEERARKIITLAGHMAETINIHSNLNDATKREYNKRYEKLFWAMTENFVEAEKRHKELKEKLEDLESKTPPAETE